MGGKKPSGAAKRKKKKEKEEAIERAREEMERLKLGPTKLWTGLVTHHRDIFVSHVLPKLNGTDRYFFAKANIKHLDLLEYAEVDISEIGWNTHECSSISTLEFAWYNANWGRKDIYGRVIDQAWFCAQVAATNELELLKWVREEKKCEWNERTIEFAADIGNLEMLKYCFANDCPYNEEKTCVNAASEGDLDCLRFLVGMVKPSRKTEQKVADSAAGAGQLDILKYLVEEINISYSAMFDCVGRAAIRGHLDCVKYLVEEAKVTLNHWIHIAHTRYYRQTECLHYFREMGCPEPTDEQYAKFLEQVRAS